MACPQSTRLLDLIKGADAYSNLRILTLLLFLETTEHSPLLGRSISVLSGSLNTWSS